jgi:ABC-type cobalamin/Fe3+-siderophores transport system ATPase subunit
VPFGFRYSRIVISDGTTVELPADGVVVFVGPNNAGKSAALRELHQFLTTQPGLPHGRKVLTDITVSPEGTPDELIEWLENHSFILERHDGRHYRRPNAVVADHQARSEWGQAPWLPTLHAYFVFFGAADNRLGLLGGASAYNPVDEGPQQPMQVLFARPEIERRLSETAFEAFGTKLTLSRIFGANLDLYVGEIDIAPTVVPTREYIEAIQALPMLQGQGDGMRSFMGLMLALTTSQFRVIIVDEPEAFLHPPQARLLGRKLATEAPQGTQVIVATHSLDVLQGLLTPAGANVTVVRLVRDGDVNRTSVLEPDELREIWNDPLLRYSNVLEGLFHKGVVLSESDSDSRYYAAVLDGIRDEQALPPHDLLFAQSGGKHRFPLVIRALRAVSVPVAVVADFDVLREEPLLRQIAVALEGDWEQIRPLWNPVAAAISAMGNAPTLVTAREAVTEVLNAAEGSRLSRDDAQAIRDATRVDDGWGRVKQGGLAMLPQGETSERAALLLNALSELGLFVVPVGELERWATDVGRHGPAWVSEALERNRHVENAEAPREFVTRVTDFFAR